MVDFQCGFIEMKVHGISIFPTHNLEVPGSSPGWSTLKIKQLRNFVAAFFLCLRKQCVNKLFELEYDT